MACSSGRGHILLLTLFAALLGQTSILLIMGCAGRPQQSFVGPPEIRAWMQRALAQPHSNPAFHRFALAYRGEPEGLHGYFAEAVRQAESPEINVESGEGFSWELRTIIQEIGDARFAAALAREPERVRSAVASCFAGAVPPGFHQTQRLLDSAPELEFPMLKTYRGNYRPATPRASSETDQAERRGQVRSLNRPQQA